MSPPPDHPMEQPGSPLHPLSDEEHHRFHHARNKTGHKDPRPYSDDPIINQRWAELSNLQINSKPSS